MKLKIPYHRQKKNYTCGPAVLQMVFEYFKTYVPQKKLAKAAGTNKKSGTGHKAMIDLARSHGFFCYVNENSTINEIKHFIELGFPVIVNYIEPSQNEGHWAVVSGFNGREIILNDPWNGKNFHLSQRWFKNHWHNKSGNRKKSLLVLFKKSG